MILPRIVVLAIAAAFAYPASADPLPLNPEVTQASIGETICLTGWTKTVRPPASYTNTIKRQRVLDLGLPLELIGDFQLDHRIPLSLGGAPSDPRNLELMDLDEAEEKDEVERCLPRVVCRGRVTLAEAQRAIWSDWRDARSLCKK